MNLTSYKKFYFHCLVSVELKPHTKVSKNLFHNMALKNLYVTTMLPSKTRLKQYYNNAINVRISLDGYVSEIQKVSRCRPKVSNETIPATKLEFFFKKVTPVTDTVILGFWLIILPWMFISSYTTIYFFIKIFFSNVYISVNLIFKCSYLLFGWEIGHPLSMYATGGMEEGHPKPISVIRYVCTKWMAPNKCCGIVFVHWFGQVH